MMEVKSLTQIAEENRLSQITINEIRMTALFIGICGVILGVASVWLAFGVHNLIISI